MNECQVQHNLPGNTLAFYSNLVRKAPVVGTGFSEDSDENRSIGGRVEFEGHVVEVVQQTGFGQAGVGERTGPEAPGLCTD